MIRLHYPDYDVVAVILQGVEAAAALRALAGDQLLQMPGASGVRATLRACAADGKPFTRQLEQLAAHVLRSHDAFAVRSQGNAIRSGGEVASAGGGIDAAEARLIEIRERYASPRPQQLRLGGL
jgi:hypothetical protein